jgi:hypothetical protein
MFRHSDADGDHGNRTANAKMQRRQRTRRKTAPQRRKWTTATTREPQMNADKDGGYATAEAPTRTSQPHLCPGTGRDVFRCARSDLIRERQRAKTRAAIVTVEC